MRGTPRRLRRTITIAAVGACATGAGVALAQAPAVLAPGDYGGGAIAVPVSEKTIAKDMLMAISVLPDGQIGVSGSISARCGSGLIKGETAIGADGSFTLRGTATRRPLVGVAQRSTFVVKGLLTADGGEGTAGLKLRVRVKGGATRDCKSRTVGWKVRRAGVPAGAPGAAPAGSTLYGLTSQESAPTKQAIVLHTSSTGGTIDRVTLGFRAPCDRGRVVSPRDVNVSPEFDVAPDGSFRAVERFTTSYSDLRQRTTVIVSGQFDANGAAAGKASVTQRFSNRRNGKRVDVCASGTRTWSARP